MISDYQHQRNPLNQTSEEYLCMLRFFWECVMRSACSKRDSKNRSTRIYRALNQAEEGLMQDATNQLTFQLRPQEKEKKILFQLSKVSGAIEGKKLRLPWHPWTAQTDTGRQCSTVKNRTVVRRIDMRGSCYLAADVGE